MFPLRTIATGVFLLLVSAAGFIYIIARPKPRLESLQPEPLQAGEVRPTPEATPDQSPTPVFETKIEGSTIRPKSQPAAIKQFSVQLLTPSMAETFTAPATVKLAAAANPQRGLQVIEFYQYPEGHSFCQSLTTPEASPNRTKIGEARSAPYQFEWPNVDRGVFTIVAVASYKTGEQQISPPVVIVVNSAQDLEGPNWTGWRPPYSVEQQPEQVASLMPTPTPTPTLDLCPTITVNRLPISPYSNTINFQATLAGNEVPPDPTFQWEVSVGRIVSGQGTPTISVVVNKIVDRRIVASVNVGHLHGICPSSAFSSVDFEQPRWITQSLRNLLQGLQARGWLEALSNDRHARGVIQLSGDRENCVDSELLKEGRLLKRYFIELQGLNGDRISIVNGGRIERNDDTADLEFLIPSPDDPQPSWLQEAEKRPLVACRTRGPVAEVRPLASLTPINRKCPDLDESVSYQTDLHGDAQEINTCPFNARDPQNSKTQVALSSKTVAGTYADFPAFEYWANGGAILNKGPKGIWDLSAMKLRPGTYTAIAKANDGCDCVSIRTAAVAVTNFCTPCLTLTRVCGEGFQHFRASAAKFTIAGETTFHWTTSRGTIVSGQGTPDLMVDTTGLAPGEKYVVSAAVGGLLRYCVNKLSVTAVVEEFPCKAAAKVDDYGSLRAGQRRARRREMPQEDSQAPNPDQTKVSEGPESNGDRVRPRTNEKEWMKVSWTPRVKTDQPVNIEVVYNRTTETFQVSNTPGEVSEELKLGKLLRDWFGKDYETFGDVRLRTAGLKCDSCNQEQYQSLDREKLEWSWPLKPDGKGTQSFNVELWVKGVPRDKNSGKATQPAEKVWSRNDVRIEVTEPFITRNTVFAGGGLCAVLGLGLCVRGVKIYRVGDTYNVGQAVAVGRNVTMNNTTVTQQTDKNVQTGDKKDG